MNPSSLEDKLVHAVQTLARGKNAFVCYSGGVDSTLVLAACLRGGVDTVALLGVSASLPAAEREDAHRIAGLIGAPLEEVSTDEMDLEGYRNNAGDRCYFCKSALYHRVKLVAAAKRDAGVIFVGTQVDDMGAHRPGLQAAMEHGVVSPLVEAGFTKADVRELARYWQLPNAEKPAAPCLASRIPAGSQVTPGRLAQIEAVESFLRTHNIWPARARWHDAIVRLELPSRFYARVVAEPFRSELRDACLDAGFKFVALDLNGLQSGSLSLPLAAS